MPGTGGENPGASGWGGRDGRKKSEVSESGRRFFFVFVEEEKE